jgi:tetratricopeptide (TPR) repeat protein
LIVAAALAAYHNSFLGTFAYDDQGAIVENQTIRQLWPIWPALFPPRSGDTVSGRPLLNFSLAVNYALGGLDVRGYHAANLVIHIAAALLLMGILRRTFLTPALRDRFGKVATPLALASALIWALHPLQTESVTYIVQRAESRMSLFYLLTLYCVIRGAERKGTVPILAPTMLRMVPEMGLSPSAGAAPVGQAFQPDTESAIVRLESLTYPASSPGERGDSAPWPWYAVSVLFCLLGMACKEVMVTAPLVVLLYDRTFLAGSFAAVFRGRWGLYVSLAATWGLLAYLVLSTGLIGRQSELGAPDVWSYARTQPGVILHYLQLSVWPASLCMSYEWPVADTLSEILPGAIVVGLLLAATVWGLVGRKAWGFLGAWFFLILAPTSSILSLNQLAYEHRMYLPLAAVAVLTVAGGYALWDRLLPQPAGQGGQSPFSPGMTLSKVGFWAAKKGTVPDRARVAHWAAPVAVLAALATALGIATALRNSDYRSLLVLWQDTVNKNPNNPILHYDFGAVLFRLGRTDEAIEQYVQALRLKPDYFEAHNNLGNALAAIGNSGEAIEQYHRALRLHPGFAEAHYNLGNALGEAGRTDEAIEHYHAALRIKPDYAEAHNNLGLLLASLGKTAEAIEHYQQALRSKPDFVEAHNNLGKALADASRMSEAIAQWEQAIRLKPDYAEAHYNLGSALVLSGNWREAVQHYREALRLKPDYPKARYGLANAHYRLANALVRADRIHEAAAHYSEVLRLLPDAIEALNDLAWLLATHEPAQGGDAARAVQLAQRARELNGQENPQCLDTLAAAYAAAGRFAEAVSTAEQALRLAESAGQTTLVHNIQSRLELYSDDCPYREPPLTRAE